MSKILAIILIFHIVGSINASIPERNACILIDSINEQETCDIKKGNIPYPCNGNAIVTEHYGNHNVKGMKDTTINNKGIVLYTDKGANARSVCDGVVSAVFVYAGKYNVILRHGEYLSVYLGLKSVFVEEKQKIPALHLIGEVNDERLLGFQLRKGIIVLNPEEWFLVAE